MKPSALGESATETVLHALPKPVVGLDVLPGNVDFGKTEDVWSMAVDDLTKMSIFGLIIVIRQAATLDAEDAEIVVFIVTGVAVETACVKWVGWDGWVGEKTRRRDGGHNYALSPFGGGTGWMVGLDAFSIKESKRWMIDMICFCIADTLVARMSTEEVRSDVSSPAEWEVRVLFDPLDRVDLSLDRIELGDAERFL